MKHLFSVTLLISIFVAGSFSQEYFPHAKGNKWVYKYFNTAGAHVGYYINEVKADTVMQNGKKYFRISRSGLFEQYSFGRIDSNSLYYYNTFTGAEGRAFRFGASIGSQWSVPELNWARVTLQSMDSVIIFSRKVKTIIFVGVSYPSKTYTFAESFGIIKELNLGSLQPGAQDYTLTTLEGCIINGVTYGDLTSVEKIESTIPERVNLFPSYPNPFNGQTTIRFSLDRREHLQLAIYDILGREVTVLVGKELDGGVYSTQWIPGGVGSGVYLVRLRTTHNALTQKIIYMK